MISETRREGSEAKIVSLVCGSLSLFFVRSLIMYVYLVTGSSMGMPDLHSGYGFSIGGVAAFDMENPEAIVSPGGVGFDINW